jgi:hypothetical protein
MSGGGGGGGGFYDSHQRANLLQQAQSHSFNTDMLSSSDFSQQDNFNRNNMKRQTLKRAPRINDNEPPELTEEEFASLSPQQQQHLIMLRSQQYSNSSGQESGIGSSVYTNSANEILNNRHMPSNNQMLDSNIAQRQLSSQQQQQQQSPPPVDMVTAQQALPLPRRKSLPSIVKTKSYREDETAYSSSELNNKNQETFIIENGIKKRVIEKINSDAHMAADSDEATTRRRAPTTIDFDNGTPQLPRKMIIESITSVSQAPSSSKEAKRVSMPSIQAYLNPKFANKGSFFLLSFCSVLIEISVSNRIELTYPGLAIHIRKLMLSFTVNLFEAWSILNPIFYFFKEIYNIQTLI